MVARTILSPPGLGGMRLSFRRVRITRPTFLDALLGAKRERGLLSNGIVRSLQLEFSNEPSDPVGGNFRGMQSMAAFVGCHLFAR